MSKEQLHVWSKNSANNLSECHPMLQALFNEVLPLWDCSILDGYRSEEEQNRAFTENRSKLRYPNSKHNKTPSEGIDVKPAKTEWDDYNTIYMFVGFVKGIASQLEFGDLIVGDYLRCGADWDGDNDINDQTFHDIVHFEIINVDEINKLTCTPELSFWI